MSDPPVELQEPGTWSKLRRRKVVHWGLAYAAGAWALLQVLGFAVDTFAWPVIIKQLAMLAFALGLPIAVALAWYHGDRGQQRVTGSELAVLSLLLLVGGGLLAIYAQRRVGPGPEPPPARTEAPDIAATDSPPSIAVLPFENRSRLDDDIFFVDGIHDDILAQLSKVSALRVISRTSVERFRDTNLPTKTIAGQLGATKILEGGVQRAGDHVRINVQLIDAATDSHLWAETYDRELTAANIFAIQSEVAAAIAVALETTLTPAERVRVNAVATRNLAAWEAYQLGKQRMARRTTSSLAEAEQYLRQAIDHDPSFAPAYAALADAIWLKADYGGLPFEPAKAEAMVQVRKALALDPDLAEAHTTSAKFAQEQRDFAVAEASYRKAIELNPNYPTAHQWYAQLLALLGRDAEALARTRKAVELDPLSVALRVNLALGLSGSGRFDESMSEFAAAHEIDPSNPAPYDGVALIQTTGFGRLDTAVPFVEKAIELDTTGLRHHRLLAQILLDLGEDERAARSLANAFADGSTHRLLAHQHLYRGEYTEALEAARKAFEYDPREQGALALVAVADRASDDDLAALARYARVFPELLEQAVPTVDPSNFKAAIDVARLQLALGQRDRAQHLLERSEALLRKVPRLGPWGYWLSDAQIFALRGEHEKALAALRVAVKEGWRGPFWRYYRDLDPNLASIRNQAGFEAAFAEIQSDLTQQRTRLAGRPRDARLEFVQAPAATPPR